MNGVYRMKKRIVILCCLLIIMTIMIVSASTSDILPETVQKANEELGLQYYTSKSQKTGLPLNVKLANNDWSGIDLPSGAETGNVFVYGTPWDNGRYLGKTVKEEDDFTNFFFPNDAWAGGYIEDRYWIENPWNNDDTKDKARETTFDANTVGDKYKLNMIGGLKEYYGSALKGEQEAPEWYANIHRYIHVLQPPTYSSWGLGRMWHKEASGAIWYMTVPLIPGELIDSRISACLTVSPEPDLVKAPGEDVKVTLDSSGSSAMLGEEDTAITSRYYWACKTEAELEDIGKVTPATTEEVKNITVPNVVPNSWIYCKVRVESQALKDKGRTYWAEKTEKIYIDKWRQPPPPDPQERHYKDMEPNASGVIKAEVRGAEKFDVSKGIPSSENLYANVDRTKQYLYDTLLVKEIGRKSYSVTVSKTYHLEWEEKHTRKVTERETDENGVVHTHTSYETYLVPKSDTKVVSKTYIVTRGYDYWFIDNLEAYGLNRAELQNEALPEESVTLYPEGYTPPGFDIWHSDAESDHIREPSYSNVNLGSETIDGGESRPSVPSPNWRGEAEAAVGPIQVKNDRLIVNTTTVTEDSLYDADTPDPEEFPASPNVGRDMLYEDGLTIEAEKLNGIYDSTGTIYYDRLEDIDGINGDQWSDSITVNPVTVHTPVVCYAQTWSDINYNQELAPDGSRASLILDRPSKINLPTSGQHLNILGYGNKDYKKYTKEKQVKFPFDVYIDTAYKENGKYLAADTWYTVPLSQSVTDFYLPTWVQEGNYEIQYREIAINAPDLTSTEDLYNKELEDYVATKTMPVRVIGRLYGLRITDIADYPTWEEVFRTGKGTAEHSGKYYWTGTKDQNGQNRGNSEQMTMPVLNGSHARLKNIGAVKSGYRFRFDLTTIGNYEGEDDWVKIAPKFYYVKKDGTGRQEADLWYNESFGGKDNYFVKVGSTKDGENKKYIKLGDPYRNVPEADLKDTSQQLDIAEGTLKNQQAGIGTFAGIKLEKSLRTFVGDITNLPSGVNKDKVKKSVQKWYGEYYMPDMVYAVPKGYNVTEYARKNNGLTGKESIWLKDGYIIVNFDIETVKNGETAPGVLSYGKAPNSDMWEIEGYGDQKRDSSGAVFTLEEGDVIYYYANKRASDDYKAGGNQ